MNKTRKYVTSHTENLEKEEHTRPNILIASETNNTKSLYRTEKRTLT